MRGTMRGGPIRGMRGNAIGPSRGFNGISRMAGRGTGNGISNNGLTGPSRDAMEWSGMVRGGGFPGPHGNVSFSGDSNTRVQSYKPNIVARTLSQDAKSGNGFKAILQRFFERNSLGVIPFEVSAVGNKFTAKVRVKSEEFKTSPQSFGSEDEAIEAVSKICTNRMNIQKDGSVMKESKDKVMMVYRVEQILKGKEGGVWSTMVEKQYEKQHKEQLPSLWWEKVNVVRVEPLSAGSKIMIVYPVEDPEQNQNDQKDTNGISCSDSSEMMIGYDNDTISFPTSQNQPSHGIEANLGEGEYKFLHVLPDLSPPDNDSWFVYVTVVASTDEIYVKFIGDDYSERFDEVSEAMDNLYGSVKHPGVKEVILDQIYAAKADDGWHRVQVTDVNQLDKISCWFLDCGDEDVIDKKDLRELDEKFLSLPAQAFPISLHGVKKSMENVALIEKLNKELVEKSFIAKVEFAEDDEKCPKVILFDTSKDEEGVNMNQKINEFLNKQELFNSSDDDDSKASSSLDASLSDTPEDDLHDVDIEKKFTTEVNKHLPVVTVPRVNEDFDIRCCLTFSPSNFVVQPLNYADQLDDLKSALAAFYNHPSNQTTILGDAKEGDFYAAQREDGGWYRVRVVREIGHLKGLLVVRSVDYGENFIVKLNKLRPLAPEFRHLPMQAVLAKLAQVHPPAGDWTREDISWFENRVTGQDFVSRVTGVSTGFTGEMVMELVLIDTSHPQLDKYVAKELMDRM